EAQIELGPERALAGATEYLDAFGTIAVAWRWLVQAFVVSTRSPDDFGAGKLIACRWFFRNELERAVATLDRLARLDDLASALRPETL
ncbi:MAG TPA: acyl-CoA dehydrogenase C-terminal domain-containing protein, partial [Candidatus Elarobacter sp.]